MEFVNWISGIVIKLESNWFFHISRWVKIQEDFISAGDKGIDSLWQVQKINITEQSTIADKKFLRKKIFWLYLE